MPTFFISNSIFRNPELTGCSIFNLRENQNFLSQGNYVQFPPSAMPIPIKNFVAFIFKVSTGNFFAYLPFLAVLHYITVIRESKYINRQLSSITRQKEGVMSVFTLLHRNGRKTKGRKNDAGRNGRRRGRLITVTKRCSEHGDQNVQENQFICAVVVRELYCKKCRRALQDNEVDAKGRCKIHFCRVNCDETRCAKPLRLVLTTST